MYGAGTFMLGSAALIVVPVYARILGPSGFGVLELFVAGISLGQAVLVLGSDTAIAILVHRTGDAVARRSVVSSASALAVGVAALVLFVGSAASIVTGPAALVAAVAIACTIMHVVWLAALRNLDRPRSFLIATSLYALATVSVGLFSVAGLGLGPLGGVLGVAAGAACGSLMAAWSLRDHLSVRLIATVVLRQITRLGVPLIPAAVALWTIGYSDRFLVAWMASPTAVGLYAAAWKIALGVSIGVSAFLLAWTPYAMRIQRSPDAARLYAAAFTAFVAAGACLTILAALVAGPLIELFAGAEFASARPLIWILVGSVFLYGSSAMLAVILQIGLHTGVVGLVSLAGAACKVIVTLLLVPPLGPVGAAAATAAGYALIAIGLYVMGQRRSPHTYPLPYIALAAILAAVVAWLVTHGGMNTAIAWILGIGASCLLAIVGWRHMSAAGLLIRASRDCTPR
jgi:O-antigen/teichoic acid export membrane protein